jgi:radical SAM superfamily enzyme YgiQ (UPF0313 family)
MRWQKEQFPGLDKLEVAGAAMNLDMAMLSGLCDEIIGNGVKIKWGGSALFRKEMTPHIIKKMRDSGCNCIGYSLESGSQKVVDDMGKGFLVEDAERIVRDTHEAGIETILNIIVGFPGETERDFEQTMRFIERNSGYISWITAPNECMVMAKTYMAEHPDKMGIELSEEGELFWRSKDRTNDHLERQRRLSILKDFIKTKNLNIDSFQTIHLRNMKH